jgi:hypothetical protein
VTSPVHEGLISAVIAEEFARGIFDDDPLAPAFLLPRRKSLHLRNPAPEAGIAPQACWDFALNKQKQALELNRGRMRIPRVTARQASGNEKIWRCLYCRDPLISGGLGLRCSGRGRQYPMVAGIPLLVRRPTDYFRAARAGSFRPHAKPERTGTCSIKSNYMRVWPMQRWRVTEMYWMSKRRKPRRYLPCSSRLHRRLRHWPTRRMNRRSHARVGGLIRWCPISCGTSELRVTSSGIGAALEHVFPGGCLRRVRRR